MFHHSSFSLLNESSFSLLDHPYLHLLERIRVLSSKSLQTEAVFKTVEKLLRDTPLVYKLRQLDLVAVRICKRQGTDRFRQVISVRDRAGETTREE